MSKKVERDFVKDFLLSTEIEEKAIETSMKELNRKIKKGDVDGVDEIVDFLLEMQGYDESEEIDIQKSIDKLMSDINDELYNDSVNKRKKFNISKKAVVAVASVIVLFTTNTIVRATTNESILTLAVNIAENSFSIDNNKVIKLPVSENDPYGIRTECQKYKYTPDVPFYLPEGFELMEMHQSTPSNYDFDSRFNAFKFKKGTSCILFNYNYDPNMSDSMPLRYDESECTVITINGAQAALVKRENGYTVDYYKNKITYFIDFQYVDFDEIDKVINSIG